MSNVFNLRDRGINEKELNELKRKQQETIEWAKQMPQRFLAAWKRGVKLAGKHYFKVQGNIDAATDKEQLAPDYDVIEKIIHKLSSGERAFLAAMYSFYNAQTGQYFLEEIELQNIHQIAMDLDKERREIIAELFINDQGW